MKKHCCWMLAFLLLLSACTRTAAPAEGAPEAVPGAEQASDMPDAEKLLETLCSAEFMGRAVGGAGNVLAADYIAAQFEALGLEPLQDGYLVPYQEQCVLMENAAAEAALIAADGTRTELTAGADFVFYPVYEAVNITLPLSADAAACTDGAAFFYMKDGKTLGRFLIDNPGAFAVSCENLESVMSLNNNLRRQRGVGVVVSEDFRPLLAAPGTKLELSLSPCVEEGTASNVAAVLRGSEGKNAFVVGGHFDGLGLCGSLLYPSAFDNASGTVAMLETARRLAGAQLKNDVIFVAFNGEESGFSGSSDFADRMLEEYERVDLINLDCVGYRDNAVCTVFDNYGLNAPLKEALLKELGEQGAGGEYIPGDGMIFDGKKANCCVTVADVSGEEVLGLSVIHCPRDTPEQIDCDRIRDLADAIAELLRADVIYGKNEALLAEEPDEWTGLMPAELTQYNGLTESGTLSAYTQGYVYQTENGSSTVLDGGLKKILSTAELEAAFPGTAMPERLGDYSFVFAEAVGALGTDIYGVRTVLPEELEVGTVVDLTGRISLRILTAYYLSADGRGLTIALSSSMDTSYDEMEDGGAVDSALTGALLQHAADGYWRLNLPVENRYMINIGFFDGTTLTVPQTGWEYNLEQRTHKRYLSAEELVSEFEALDLTPVKAVCGTLAG